MLSLWEPPGLLEPLASAGRYAAFGMVGNRSAAPLIGSACAIKSADAAHFLLRRIDEHATHCGRIGAVGGGDITQHMGLEQTILWRLGHHHAFESGVRLLAIGHFAAAAACPVATRIGHPILAVTAKRILRVAGRFEDEALRHRCGRHGQREHQRADDQAGAKGL